MAGKERARGSSPLVLLRGTEVAGKPGTEKASLSGAGTCPEREDWSGGFFRLPQGLGKYKIATSYI